MNILPNFEEHLNNHFEECEDLTTTGGDRSLISEDQFMPLLVNPAVQQIDLNSKNNLRVLGFLRINTPMGPIEVTLREGDSFEEVADQICHKGNLRVEGMREAMLIFLERKAEEQQEAEE
mmetsp:Transcript_31887/g.31149  ORF Transcript_31887/g.31149 Transcript_31887/m.31149 type:complete len:120 (+) Transcript_31887:823-1182(+)|eukprot:CAMPEP_0170560870 /NCGR_PEP_ID=MMETSP0211-20121228/51554_1 /TAXON_ID=311385 /ORGANISM="Pseudokeronopsis sp., Strain OXSARD2" /LENGTH=119 /DNA_ID=CAMNT_0010875673 /DNA_START=752 /DNA_END=1111 /DNA_ORIENTATION=+